MEIPLHGAHGGHRGRQLAGGAFIGSGSLCYQELRRRRAERCEGVFPDAGVQAKKPPEGGFFAVVMAALSKAIFDRGRIGRNIDLVSKVVIRMIVLKVIVVVVKRETNATCNVITYT